MIKKVGIVGHRGYSGAELVRILQHHSGVDPLLLEHSDDHAHRSPIRNHKLPASIPCTREAVQDAGVALVFLATPPEVSMELAGTMLDAGARVVDLSGAFRLRTPENYNAWYKEPHTRPDLLAEAVYGLPEFCRERIPAARLIANPGCYPTAANLAIRPLIEAGVVDRAAGIVCDAKSGVSGAGRKPRLSSSFCEVTENFSAYSVLRPPACARSAADLRPGRSASSALPRSFCRSTAASSRLSISAPRAWRAPKIWCASTKTATRASRFIRIYQPGHLPDLHAVARTNFCDIGVTFDAASGRAVVVSAIDNLVKGAAGQAVQNMNLMLGFPETEGLL